MQHCSFSFLKLSMFLVMLPILGYLLYRSLHDLSILPELFSDPDGGWSMEKGSPCVVVSCRDEPFDIYVKLSRLNTQCFFSSWDKEPTARQRGYSIRIWVSVLTVMPSQEGGRETGNVSLDS